MFADPNRLYLGSETYNDDAVVHFVDGDFDVRTDKDAIDPDSDFEHLWSIDADAENLIFRDEQEGDDLLTLGHGEASFGGGVTLAGDFKDVNVIDDMMRLSGFSNRFEFRRSSTDWDQILEFRRRSNSDYDAYLHRNDDPYEILTTDHDIDAATLDGNDPDEFLLGGLTALNSGNVAHDSVYQINFGDDLGVTATTNGVTVDYVGATIPAVVYDDGIEVVSDANGLNFQEGLNVSVDANNVAEVEAPLPVSVTQDDVDETVSGQWTFEQTILGEAESAQTAAEADFAHDIDNAIIDDFITPSDDVVAGGSWLYTNDIAVTTGTELGFGDNNEFRTRYSSATDQFILETDVSGNATAVTTVERTSETVNVQFDLEQDGEQVATESWVETEADTFDPAESHTFTADQHFDAGIDASNGDYIAFPVHSSEPDHTNWPDGAGWYRSDLA